jgi:hypothetical protein
MLDLSVPTRVVSGVDLAADHENPLLFYALPPPPKLRRVDGQPDIQLLRLIRNGELAGGFLRLAMQAGHEPATIEDVRSTLAAELKKDQVEVSVIPAKEATADLSFIGRETTDTGGTSALLRRTYEKSPAAFDSPYTAAFSVSLASEGVRLVEAAMRSGTAPIGVTYQLQIEGLWPAQRIQARVDWGQVYDHFSTHLREGFLISSDDILQISEELVQSRAIRVNVVQGLAGESESSSSIEAAMAWIQRELVEHFCEPVLPLNRRPAHASLGTLGEMFGLGYSFVSKKLTQIERATAEIDFQQRRVVTRTITLQSHLADLLGNINPADRIVDGGMDHPFFRRMTLHIRPAQTLESVQLKEVLLNVDYGTADAALRLIPASQEANFEAWADASPDGKWSIQPEVTFADNATVAPTGRFKVDPITGTNRELTLDLKRLLGLTRLELRPTVDPRVALSELRIVQSRNTEELDSRDLVLPAPGNVTPLWFRDSRPGDRITIAIRYMLVDGRIVALPPLSVETEIVRLPPAFPGVLTVRLLSDTDWTDLTRVTVAIQKSADAPTGSFTFEQPDKIIPVNLDMPDPTDRTFRYRMTRILSSGLVEEDPWIQTDVPVVVAGRIAATKLVVDVTPVGPDMAQAGIRLIQVELLYVDADHQVRDEQTAVITARADRFHWEVPIQDPQRREYEYRVSVFRLAGGPAQVGRWTKSIGRLLTIPIVAAN